MARSIAFTLVVAAVAAQVVLADVVHLKDGRTVEGQATWIGDRLVVESKLGSARYLRADVLRVEEREVPTLQVARRRAALVTGDVEGRIELARFALGYDLEADARALTLEAIERAPEHPVGLALLAELAFERQGGAWVAPEARGLVRVRGRWTTAADAEALGDAADLRAAAQEASAARSRARLAERSHENAEGDVAEAEAERTKARARVEHYASEQARIAGIAAEAEAERTALLPAVTYAEGELAKSRALLARSAPCRCPCPAQAARARFEAAVADCQRAVNEARGAIAAATKRARQAAQDAETAQQLTAQAKRKLARAEAALVTATRDEEKARAKRATTATRRVEAEARAGR
jgi:hypothetical protein